MCLPRSGITAMRWAQPWNATYSGGLASPSEDCRSLRSVLEVPRCSAWSAQQAQSALLPSTGDQQSPHAAAHLPRINIYRPTMHVVAPPREAIIGGGHADI